MDLYFLRERSGAGDVTKHHRGCCEWIHLGPCCFVYQVLLHFNKGPGRQDTVCRLLEMITAHADVGPAPLITSAYEDVSGVY